MKNTIFAIILIALAGLGGWYYYNFIKYAPKIYVEDSQVVSQTENGSETKSVSTTVNTVTNETTKVTPTYTLADISLHNNVSSCYSTISSSVYDLTMWVNLHPGGKGAILSMCGNDGTDAFMNEHRGGSKFMKILARYKIGNLIK